MKGVRRGDGGESGVGVGMILQSEEGSGYPDQKQAPKPSNTPECMIQGKEPVCLLAKCKSMISGKGVNPSP